MLWLSFRIHRLKRGMKHRHLHWAGWAAAMTILYVFAFPLKSTHPFDFYGFWIIGQEIQSTATPVGNAYSYSGGVRIARAAKANSAGSRSSVERWLRRSMTHLDTTSTPLLYAAFKLVSGGNFAKDYDRFRIASAVIYAVAILAFAFYLKLPWWSSPILIYGFTMLFWPFRRDVIDANNSAALAGLTIGALLLLRSPKTGFRVAAGFALGLVAAIKPTIAYAPFLIMLYFFLTDRRALLWFGLGFFLAVVVAAVVPSLVLGPGCTWQHWWGAASGRAFQMRRSAGGVPGRVLNIADKHLFKYFTYPVLAAFSAVLWWIFRRPEPLVSERFQMMRSPSGMGAIASGSVGLTCYLLSGPLVWGHYFTLAVPAALLSLRPRPYRADNGRVVRVIGLLGCALIGFHHLFRAWGWTNWGNYSPFSYAGTLIVTAIVFWDLWDYRRWRPILTGDPSPAVPAR